MEILENLSNILESILFVAGNPVPVAAIAEKLGVSADDVRAAADKLRQRYEERGGLRLLQFNHKLQLSSNPDYKDYIGAVLNPIKEREFTKTILECAAIIAYKQPVTKLEIEKIRGVKCDHAVNKLIEYNLVQEVGRLDAPGRPILLGTTEEFLRNFGVQGLDELPEIDPVQVEDFKAEAEEEVQLQLNV